MMNGWLSEARTALSFHSCSCIFFSVSTDRSTFLSAKMAPVFTSLTAATAPKAPDPMSRSTTSVLSLLQPTLPIAKAPRSSMLRNNWAGSADRATERSMQRATQSTSAVAVVLSVAPSEAMLSWPSVSPAVQRPHLEGVPAALTTECSTQPETSRCSHADCAPWCVSGLPAAKVAAEKEKDKESSSMGGMSAKSSVHCSSERTVTGWERIVGSTHSISAKSCSRIE
mmetsp:Transcript_27801/g.64894  ORF Transcript_27801/g.64894 Transcript_27801/m.64894 type:complete len:226 (-) Transcript_27801:1486-2163(-)